MTRVDNITDETKADCYEKLRELDDQQRRITGEIIRISSNGLKNNRAEKREIARKGRKLTKVQAEMAELRIRLAEF